jgi:hypothetical protein
MLALDYEYSTALDIYRNWSFSDPVVSRNNPILSDSVWSHTANSSLWRLRIERDARLLPQHLCLGSKDDFPGTSSASSKQTREFELAERKWRQRCFSTKVNPPCFINGTSIETVAKKWVAETETLNGLITGLKLPGQVTWWKRDDGNKVLSLPSLESDGSARAHSNTQRIMRRYGKP